MCKKELNCALLSVGVRFKELTQVCDKLIIKMRFVLLNMAQCSAKLHFDLSRLSEDKSAHMRKDEEDQKTRQGCCLLCLVLLFLSVPLHFTLTPELCSSSPQIIQHEGKMWKPSVWKQLNRNFFYTVISPIIHLDDGNKTSMSLSLVKPMSVNNVDCGQELSSP